MKITHKCLIILILNFSSIDSVLANMCFKYLEISSKKISSVENLWASEGQMYIRFNSSEFNLLISETGYILNGKIFLWKSFNEDRDSILLVVRDMFLVSRNDQHKFLDRYDKNYVFGSLHLSSVSRVLFSENKISVIYSDGKKVDMIPNFNFKERSLDDGLLLEALERLKPLLIN